MEIREIMSASNDYNAHVLARKLLYEQDYGILSTISTEIEVKNYPFGSVTPYCIDNSGQVIILVSNIAEHTKNMKANSRVSLTILEKITGNGNVQAQGRLTYVGTAEPISESEYSKISQKYLRYFPEAAHYFETHPFTFYRISLVKARFIGGFGKIFWLYPEQLCKANPFSNETEIFILEHMNADHTGAIKHYFKLYKDIILSSTEQPALVGVDMEGFDVLMNRHKHRFYFPESVTSSGQARQFFTQMAKL